MDATQVKTLNMKMSVIIGLLVVIVLLFMSIAATLSRLSYEVTTAATAVRSTADKVGDFVSSADSVVNVADYAAQYLALKRKTSA
jgi:flagellar basal body-associated protein FliL